MLIRIVESGERVEARLEQPHDFQRLSVVMSCAVDRGRADRQLTGILRFDSNQAWIDIDWLRRSGGYGADPGQSESFENMTAFARTCGWVHPITGELAAHLDYDDARR